MKKIIGIAVVLVVGFYFINTYIYNEKQADFTVGERAVAAGKILAIDLEAAALDGPVKITLETSDKDLVTIAVPSMGLPLCEAYKANKIGDVYLLEVGDEIEVAGTVSEDGSIVPCESAEHYLTTTPLVMDDFEGEADPSRMTLDMKTWNWISASYNDGRTVTPKKANAFTLKFEDGGRFSASTDCNGVGGEYATAADGKITFNQMISTLMYCEGSQEADFRNLLENTASYHFTSKGELILELKFDSGTVTFR